MGVGCREDLTPLAKGPFPLRSGADAANWQIAGKPLLRGIVTSLRRVLSGATKMKTFDFAAALALCIVAAQLLFG